jgi:hypothetical protein
VPRNKIISDKKYKCHKKFVFHKFQFFFMAIVDLSQRVPKTTFGGAPVTPSHDCDHAECGAVFRDAEFNLLVYVFWRLFAREIGSFRFPEPFSSPSFVRSPPSFNWRYTSARASITEKKFKKVQFSETLFCLKSQRSQNVWAKIHDSAAFQQS